MFSKQLRFLDMRLFFGYLVRPMTIVPKTKRGAADALRRMIRGIEDAGSPEQPRLPLGVSRIDRALPGGGLRLGCIHEVAGDEAATGFCAALLALALAARSPGGAEPGSGATQAVNALPRGARRRGTLLWLARDDDLYAPGLVRYGIGAGQLLVVSGLRRREDMLRAMEEALRCRAVHGVVAEAGGIGLAAGRRLMLAAEGTGVLGLVLSRRPGGTGWGRGARDAVARRAVALPRWPSGRVGHGLGRLRMEAGDAPRRLNWATARAPPTESRSRHPGAGIHSRFPRSHRGRRVRHTGPCPRGWRTSEGRARLHRPSQHPA